MPKLSVLDRLMNSVEINSNSCWISSLNKGHKYARLRTADKKHVYAHRFMYEEKIGPIPPGLMVCHRCDTPKCVNPEHLFLGTAKDNVNDMISKGRRKGGRPAVEEQLICSIANENPSYTSKDIAKELGCWNGTVSKCLAKHGLARGALKGTQHTKAKLTEEDVYYIRKSTESGAALARKFDVTHNSIRAIKARKNWKHLPEEELNDIC